MFGIVEYDWKCEYIMICDYFVVFKVRLGDFYRFMRNVGGGGGYKFIVRNFWVVFIGFKIIYY